MCLDALIIQYGQEIFSKEIETNYEGFLQVLVNSRVRIMHIKRNQKGIYFNGSEPALYMIERITKAVTEISGIHVIPLPLGLSRWRNGVFIFHEKLSVPQLICVILIVVGITGLKLLAKEK